jgi:hypothetical protein
MDSISQKIYKQIEQMEQGSVFTPKDFQKSGTDDAINQTLSRFVKNGHIRRLAQGVYDKPKISRFGMLPPDLMLVAKALARSTQSRIQISEAYAANKLGLSTQVPGKFICYTEGTSRTRKIGSQEIIFKRASPSKMIGAGRKAGLIIQALRYFGAENINDELLEKISSRISEPDLQELDKEKYTLPIWLQETIGKLQARQSP